MNAIKRAVEKLGTLKSNSANAINQGIYQEIIECFTPVSDGELSNQNIVDGLVLLAQKRSEVQERRYVPGFFHSNFESRRAVLEFMIKSIMKESIQKEGFSSLMNAELKATFYAPNVEGSEKLAVLAAQYLKRSNEQRREQKNSNAF